MKNQAQIERNNSKNKSRKQHRQGRFESAISFRAGKKRVTFSVPAELKSLIAHEARKLNISVASFVRLAIHESLPRLEKELGLRRNTNKKKRCEVR